MPTRNTTTALQDRDGNNRTGTHLSVNIIIKCQGNTVGAVKSFEISESRNLKMIDEVAEIFNEKLQDSDRFRDKIIDVIYNVLGRNLHINHTEIYYIGNYWINKIDGIKVNSKGNSVKWNFSPDMFIPAS